MNGPYLIIPIGILLSLLYLVSEILVRIHILGASQHQKFWNSLLLITFVVTAFFGVLIAIQTNNKLEWPLVKTLLKWHVNFGIAMSLVGVFHFFRHSRYYLKLFKPVTDIPVSGSSVEIQVLQNIKHLKVLILLSGFLSTTIQVLLIREITTVFQGNELMMSWTLGTWMFLTGSGAYIGRSKKYLANAKNLVYKTLLLLAFLPLALVPLLEIFKSSFFLPGIMVHPAWFLLILLVFLSPVCLVSGFIYSLMVHACQSENNGFTRVYSLEAAGSLAGGLIVSLVFVRWLSVIQAFLILLLLVTLLFAILRKRSRFAIGVVLLILTLIASSVFQFDKKLKSFLFVNQKVLESKETIYGNVSVTESAGQFNFFVNGSLFCSTDNTITSEEYTHYAMIQHHNPKKVLLVSGGTAGMISEILKYKTVETIDYVELNPEIIYLANKYLPISKDKRVHIIFGDCRRAIQSSSQKYDVVIFALPDPSSLQINRFYTNEFMGILKQKLNTEAVILYGLSSSGNYMSEEKKGIETSVFQSLKNNFLYVEIIPGEKDYFLASDFILRTDISRLFSSGVIETKYVNSYYIDDFSIRQRGKLIRDNLQGKIINLDEKPLPVFYHSMQFVAGYSSKGWLLILIPAIILLIPLLFMGSVATGMYMSGFTAAVFEILIIFTFQTFFGYVYSAIGLIIAIFMGGLAVGSIIGNRYSAEKKHFVFAQTLLALYALIFCFYWDLQSVIMNNLVSMLLFGLITLTVSGITGYQYVTGTKILGGNSSHNAPLMYAVDLFGAALGTIVLTVILLPLAGVIFSCLIMAFLNLLVSFYLAIRKN